MHRLFHKKEGAQNFTSSTCAPSLLYFKERGLYRRKEHGAHFNAHLVRPCNLYKVDRRSKSACAYRIFRDLRRMQV